ncbi:uncharacterized protein LOC115877249 [Sitophilus oryzae]|uniref:Uncharacterized protein LOC115877249 n=1 Tax=Sitophilus oryzae TaxID=7048 RepID=A0A6J2XER4_SITOR|nr:uncharacterized protein LOC115877249 [Sitophilus oryzae]
MTIVSSIMFKTILLFMLSSYLVFCEDVLTPDDEGSTQLDNFLDLLENLSGLSTLTPERTVTVCGKNCIVNPKGNAVWEVREQMYTTYLKQNATNPEVSIDGCLASHPSDNATFNDCMSQVRDSMIKDFNSAFDTNFISILEKDGCENFNDILNCYYIKLMKYAVIKLIKSGYRKFPIIRFAISAFSIIKIH